MKNKDQRIIINGITFGKLSPKRSKELHNHPDYAAMFKAYKLKGEPQHVIDDVDYQMYTYMMEI